MFRLFKRKRGFEFVSTDKAKTGEGKLVAQLPTRADKGSAGYDFYNPYEITIPARGKATIWTNVKAYMRKDEVLNIYVRSSAGIELDLNLANEVGIIDGSYYNNPKNEGNIGICLRNVGLQDVTIKAGERIAQGVFNKFLIADNDVVVSKQRAGGSGSSGK